ncbi:MULTISPECIES: ABC transporter substrate-binding protein [unclassified Frankia]|uniref:ABC transporter substrate-binding protein n=1 Tax=unclassified Frankia TaxID=2632575 RepID=UPI0027DE22BD|nr:MULTISPECIES: ABC transporter substrate-binding protein [unclassified Frankia]
MTPTSIKIGLIYPDTGPAGVADTFQGARSAIDARVQLQNAEGGVNGRSIDLVWGDDSSNPETFSVVAHNLIDDRKVFGLIAQSIVVGDSAPWLHQQGVPVTGVSTSAVWSNYSNLFDFGNIFIPGGITTYGDFVKAQGGTKALILVDSTVEASQDLAAQFGASLRSRGIQVLGEITYSDGFSNAARVADQLKGSGADTLIGASQTSAFIDIYSQAKALGAKINVALNESGYSPSLLGTQGRQMAGMSVIVGYAALDSPAMTTYKKAMSIYAPEVADPTDKGSLASYVAADEMIEGLRLAGTCPTRQSFIQNLRKVTSFTGSGIIAPVDLSQPKQPVRCFNFIKVDATGRSFAPVPPPTALDHNGFWCGQPLP